jgi:hypothetical protein
MDEGILAATLRAFDERAWDEVTPEVVAQAAGVPFAELASRWPTPEHLAVGAARALVERLLARAERVLDADAPLWERLEVYAGALVGALERNIGFAAALLERTATRSTLRLLAFPLASRIVAHLRGEVDRARERGEISRFTRSDPAVAELWALSGRVVLSWARDRSQGSIETQRRARGWIAELVRSWGGAVPEPP